MERLEATVDGTIYRNAENGYTVVSLKHGKSGFTAVGVMPQLSPGEQVCMEGEWVEHPQYGKQLKCVSCTPMTPTTLLGIERYLGSGLIKGVGPSTARQIVSAFGEETLTVLSEHPERLQELKGMGKKRWLQIAESYHEQTQTREAMIFLQQYGIQPGLAVKISRLYGDKTAEVIRRNPYQLCIDLEGVGFITADRIASAIGIPADSANRLQSALIYVLQQAASSYGHCYLPMPLLAERTAGMLNLPQELILHEIDALSLNRMVIRCQGDSGEDLRIYLPWLDSAEKEVAQRLCELTASRIPLRSHQVETEIAGFELQNGIRFGEQQREAITRALENRVLVITGGPGTGKTTIIRCIISLLEKTEDVVLCAPTGRAAKRMTEATGKEAKTIHRLLEYGGEEGTFARNSENPLETDCVIVDETSMMDLSLTRSLLRAVEPGTRLILVGDADQLPSVGAGNVLEDIMASGFVTVSRLTEIYRQEGTSRIVVNAHRINHGEMPLLNEKGTDFFFLHEENLQAAAQKITQLMMVRLPAYLHYTGDQIIRNIQVLAPAKKGDCGVIALNSLLQQNVNPPDVRKPSLRYGETIYRLGDKVIQTKNDYQIPWRRRTPAGWEEGAGVFNGDIGYIIRLDEEEHTFTALFDEEKEVDYQPADMENLELAYCLSIHKSQGSEFPVVIIPAVNGPRMLLTRNLLYTALTRARRQVVLVGREEIIRQMVENNSVQRRYTSLTERLKSYGEVMGLC